MPEQMSVFDLAELAADVGPNPRTIGVLLKLDGPAPDVEAVRAVVRARLGLVPRLSQRMRRRPRGSGRPVWEDVTIDLDHHVHARPAGEPDLLALTAAILSEPLDQERPSWTLTVIDLPATGTSALVWSSHHAMADGPSVLRGVLAVIQDPVDPIDRIDPHAQPPAQTTSTPPGPLRHLALLARRLLGLRELGATSGQRVPASALNQPVTAGYVLRTVDVDLAALRAGAHRSGATVNDALLWAWGRALHRRLAATGRGSPPVVVSCTVRAPSAVIENRVGAVLLPVPAPGERAADDLAALARDTTRRKRRITGSSWWLTAQVFRGIGALGLYRRFVERQRSITSLLTNMRGPAEPLYVLGRRVTHAIPVATLVGNVTAAAAALSYSGRLVVTVMCSPESAASIDLLADDLRGGLAEIERLAADDVQPRQRS